MKSTTMIISDSMRPRVVRAEVPKRIPLGFKALLSPGTGKTRFGLKLIVHKIFLDKIYLNS